jgi:23S rRNA (adenine2503-C2)-methyltransferase
MYVLKSNIDASVNFVEQQLTGFLESRYVRRHPHYFIAYLSSQTGCNHMCKMCHLTVTNQKQHINCTLDDFINQAKTVFDHYGQDESAEYVHFNFMARGEILANPTVLNNSTELLTGLGKIALQQNLIPKFNVSTIMPVTLKKSLSEVFPIITPTIYYSMYSTNLAWRAKWLPAAMPVRDALSLLQKYQSMTKKVVKIHCAFISGENDSVEEVDNMMGLLQHYGINASFNIVRYNPATPDQGVESDRIDEIAEQIGKYMTVKVIPRVGTDVKASCGTFV